MEPSIEKHFLGPDPPVGAIFVSPLPRYRPRWWLHALLFAATCLSTTVAGGVAWSTLPAELLDRPLVELVLDLRVLASGLWFSVPVIVILLSHELGHYLACRWHGLLATPPFFIPAPAPFFPIGTFGAVIRIKEPIRTKQQLLDVGAAGPIAGFVATLPFLAFGIAASEVTDTPIAGSYLSFGEPLAFDLVTALVRPGVDSASMLLHPTGVAAWFGLLLTLLNLLPLAQLDGGHIAYAVLGRWQRRLAWPLVGALAALGFAWPGWWLWAGIAVLLRPFHPPIWDEHLPLDRRRVLIGLLTLVIFVLCFMLAPIELVLDPAAAGGSS